ncbi:MAG: hypothetical protein WA610_16385 [Thermodesulfovibrionales bacterium]
MGLRAFIKRPVVVIAVALSLIIPAVYCASTGLVPYMDVNKKWSIGLYEGTSPFDLHPVQGVKNPIMRAEDVTSFSAGFVADPFIIAREDEWFLFFEAFDTRRRKGVISFARSRDHVSWHYQGVAIDEPFHLSYPYVFEADGETWMIPESAESRTIRLYRAAHFPDRWEFDRTLVEGEELVDSSVIYWHGTWWLFASGPDNASLHIYMAPSLKGPWRRHPGNPVIRGRPHGARPAGRILEHDGHLYRYAQDDQPQYGLRAYAYEIMELNEKTYRERPATGGPVVGPGTDGWNRGGMHHVDTHLLPSGRWVAAVDGRKQHLFFGLRQRR